MSLNSRALTVALSIAAAALPVAVHAADPAPVPPPVPASVPPPPRVLAPPPVSIAPSVNIVDIGSAPKAAPAPPPPANGKVDKKAAKAARRAREASEAACFSRAELKDWMVKSRLSACDAALADVEPESGPWDRRAMLLQQRALLAVNRGDLAHAEEALDEADAIGRPKADPLYDLGLGLGNDMLRAWILALRGKKDEALAQLAKLRDARPFAPSVIAAIDAIAGAIDADVKAQVGRLENRIRIDPDVMRSLIFLHLAYGDYERASAVGGQVSLVDPAARGGWTMQNAPSAYEDALRRLEFECTKAYIAARRGDAAAKEAYLAAARQVIAGYVGTDPRIDAGKKSVSKKLVQAYETRQAESAKLDEAVSEWLDALAFRSKIESDEAGEAGKVVSHFGAYKHPSEIFPALLDALDGYAALKKDDSPLAASLHDHFLSGALLQSRAEMLAKFGDYLPRPEHLEQVGSFSSNALDWLWGGNSGYTQAKESNADADLRTIRYETYTGTPALAEEQVLLAVARYAEKDGKNAFVLLSNRTVARTVTTSSCFYYVCSGGTTSNAGYVSEARVELFDAANPPARYAADPSRIITVAELGEKLTPRYQSYGERKAAIEAAKRAAKK